MKSLLDNLGVKRLTQNIKDWVNDNVQNIKDWAESKFVDSDDYLYDPLEIDYLVNNRKIKIGKIYKINYTNDYERISFKNTYKGPFYNGITARLCLKAIDTNRFCENADYSRYNDYLPIQFKYYNYDNVIQNSSKLNGYICEIRSNIGYYKFESFIYNGDKALFLRYGGSSAAQEQIIISKSDIKDGNIIEIDGINYTIYYNGLGTITWMKDEDNNETNFNNYLLKNNRRAVQGLNNIVKCNIDFGTIDGSNNTVKEGCKNINIVGSDNFVDYNCEHLDISGNTNFIGRNVKYVDIQSNDCTIGDNYQNDNDPITYTEMVVLPSYSLGNSKTNSYIRRIPLYNNDLIRDVIYRNSSNGELVFSIDIELMNIFENLFEILDNNDNEILVLHNQDLIYNEIHILDDQWGIDDDFEFISDPDFGAESFILKGKNKYIAHLCYMNSDIINSDAGIDSNAKGASFSISTKIIINLNGKPTSLCPINV